MMLREEDVSSFKKWVLPKLETISEADGEVLADYVIALVTGNDSEANVERICLEALTDFLQLNTAPFVYELVQTLKNKSYLARGHPATKSTSNTAPPAPIPSIVGNSNGSYEPCNAPATKSPPVGAPTGPAAARGLGAPHNSSDGTVGRSSAQTHRSRSSRKRKMVERDESEMGKGHDSHYEHANGATRQTKQATRNFGSNVRASQAGPERQDMSSNMANFPPPPPGLPPFDLSNPMAVMAMMSVFAPTMPGMPPLPALAAAQHEGGLGSKQKCEDYHVRGFCAAGSLCPKEHGETAPREQHRQARTSRARSSFSQPGGSIDRTNTTLVVEQIPETDCSEEHIRAFFTEFGAIDQIETHPHKRLAIIKFKDNASASRAYHSPKAVFENRFVKVYWRKHVNLNHSGNEVSGDVEVGGDGNVEEVLDLEEIARRQAEAQKAFEERRRKQEEADARAAEIEEQLKEKDEEMRQIKQQLAQLAAGHGSGSTEEEISQTLVTLQAEAETLFAQESEPHVGLGRGHSPRGGYRGRGYPARGRGFTPRSAYRGRGSVRGGFSAVKQLDNRPRRLAVIGIVKGSQTDEALRQFLVTMPECTSIEHHPEKTNALILSFDKRYQAEAFLDASCSIPDIATPLDLSWIPNDAFTSFQSATDADTHDGSSDSENTVEEGEADGGASESAGDGIGDVDADMDVADDVDRWL